MYISEPFPAEDKNESIDHKLNEQDQAIEELGIQSKPKGKIQVERKKLFHERYE